jgi:hypothetical protein
MNLYGRPGGYPRKPLRPLGESDVAQIKEGLERIGIPSLPAQAAVAD